MRSTVVLLLALLSGGCSKQFFEPSAEARGFIGTNRYVAASDAGASGFVQKKSAIFDNVSALPTGAGNAQLLSVVSGHSLFLVVVTTSNANPPSGSWPIPTDSSGDVWSLAVGPNSNGNSPTDAVQCAIYWRSSATAGTHTLTQAMALGSAYGHYSFVEATHYSAVDVTSSNSGNTNTTTGTAGTATTTTANDFQLAGLVTNTSGAGLANSAFTDPPTSMTSLIVSNATNAHAGGEHAYRVLGATGSQTVTWTWTTGTETAWCAVMATFSP